MWGYCWVNEPNRPGGEARRQERRLINSEAEFSVVMAAQRVGDPSTCPGLHISPSSFSFTSPLSLPLFLSLSLPLSTSQSPLSRSLSLPFSLTPPWSLSLVPSLSTQLSI